MLVVKWTGDCKNKINSDMKLAGCASVKCVCFKAPAVYQETFLTNISQVLTLDNAKPWNKRRKTFCEVQESTSFIPS